MYKVIDPSLKLWQLGLVILATASRTGGSLITILLVVEQELISVISTVYVPGTRFDKFILEDKNPFVPVHWS